MTRGTSSSRASDGGDGAYVGGLRRVVAVAVGEGRRFVVGRSRWLGWVAAGRRGSSEGRAAVAGRLHDMSAVRSPYPWMRK